MENKWQEKFFVKKSHKQNRIDEMTTARRLRRWCRRHSRWWKEDEHEKSDIQRLDGTVCMCTLSTQKMNFINFLFFGRERERESSVVLMIQWRVVKVNVIGRDLLVTHDNMIGFHDIIFRNSSIVEKCVFDGGFVCLLVVRLLLLCHVNLGHNVPASRCVRA